MVREAGLIHGEIEGPATCYCVNPEGVRWLKEQIESWLPACCPPIAGLRLQGASGINLGTNVIALQLPDEPKGSCC